MFVFCSFLQTEIPSPRLWSPSFSAPPPPPLGYPTLHPRQPQTGNFFLFLLFVCFSCLAFSPSLFFRHCNSTRFQYAVPARSTAKLSGADLVKQLFPLLSGLSLIQAIISHLAQLKRLDRDQEEINTLRKELWEIPDPKPISNGRAAEGPEGSPRTD